MNNIKLFETKQVRRHWDEKAEKWYFSVIDVVALLTESVNSTDYLKKLRKRDVLLGEYIGTNCPQVGMLTETGKMRFQIEDTGQGIAAEELEKIFLPFHQAGDPNYRAEGTGLGLAITQKLVDMMGGKLQLTSQDLNPDL